MEPRIGDTVDVPGGMYGTVKFVGEVAGKKGKFAGVQLATEFASRGKNNGDVDGKHYFKTTKPGSGIFLPFEKAIRKGPATPITASLTAFNQGGRMPALPKPNFSQSIGPGARAASPALKPTMRRPSLQRPDSPLRKTPARAPPKISTPASRPSLAPTSRNKMGMSSRYGQSPIGRPSNFGASLRGPSVTPLRSPLGPESSFDDESDSTPTPTPTQTKTIDHTLKDEEVRRLKDRLEEKESQLKDQAATLSDMEKSLSELQSLLPPDHDSLDHKGDAAVESEDIMQMRGVLRDKNEKIQMLIAEFDAHRADFRSTIDTLEMASTETERVYEKRVDELLQEVRQLQDRGEDVENVVQQLRQLEELVQELEEGLEDARRGEAEARGEVEFLRGEVERGRAELKREKGKAAAAIVVDQDNGRDYEIMKDLEAKDDEIRGLKAIIHSLSGDLPNRRPNGHVNGSNNSADHEQTTELKERLQKLEALLDEKSAHETDLEVELSRLRISVASDKHKSTTTTTSNHRLSDRTIVPGDWRDQKPQIKPAQLETMHESASPSTKTDTSSALWCELCETTGHDILTCINMFTDEQKQPQPSPSNTSPHGPAQQDQQEDNAASPSPKSHSTSNSNSTPSTSPASSSSTTKQTASQPKSIEAAAAATHHASSSTPMSKSKPPPHPTDLGMVAGKTSGVIDEAKWCALCERDGHESVDCPFEDAF